MCSHYSDMNNGICIAYDFTKSENNLYKYIYPINYVHRPIDVTELCEIKNQSMLAALISVISKFEDWKHEKEWRLIFYLPDDQNQRLPINHVLIQSLSFSEIDSWIMLINQKLRGVSILRF